MVLCGVEEVQSHWVDDDEVPVGVVDWRVTRHLSSREYGNMPFESNQDNNDNTLLRGTLPRGEIATGTTFLFTVSLFFTLLTSNFPTLFVLLHFIL